jgi:S1-C subfamily serine protease
MNRTNAWLSAAAACCAVTASLCTSVDDRAATTTVLSPQDPTPVAPRPATPRPTGLLGTPAFVPTDDADANDRVTPVVKAVRRAADSVVSIYVVHQDRAASRTRGGNVVDGQGSGVILDEKGLVISNWHVVALAEARAGVEIKVKLKSGKEYEAELLSTSPADDLALLQLRLPDGDVVKPVVLGNSAALEPGESVIAIGNPQGHANTVTVGVLSAQDREITVRTPDGRVNTYRGLLQTDAAINQGNSGGALLDITGKLIGINNAMAFGSENIGFAIPVDTVTRVFRDKLLSSENLARLWFGLRVQDEDGAPDRRGRSRRSRARRRAAARRSPGRRRRPTDAERARLRPQHPRRAARCALSAPRAAREADDRGRTGPAGTARGRSAASSRARTPRRHAARGSQARRGRDTRVLRRLGPSAVADPAVRLRDPRRAPGIVGGRDRTRTR